MRQFGPILECLKNYSQVSDFKFTNEEKSTAFVKFMAAEATPEAFLQNMTQKLAS